MIDPTKITPEKLVEMNDSLIVDNNYLRGRIAELERDAARAVAVEGTVMQRNRERKHV